MLYNNSYILPNEICHFIDLHTDFTQFSTVPINRTKEEFKIKHIQKTFKRY